MFTFTGMTPAQCDNMTNKWKVFMTKDGRLSLAGLNKARAGYVSPGMLCLDMCVSCARWRMPLSPPAPHRCCALQLAQAVDDSIRNH